MTIIRIKWEKLSYNHNGHAYEHEHDPTSDSVVGYIALRGVSILLVILMNLGRVCTMANDCSLGFLAVEERSGLLERAALGLDDEEVDEGKLEDEPNTVHELKGLLA
jgi:hypothetical protein